MTPSHRRNARQPTAGELLAEGVWIVSRGVTEVRMIAEYLAAPYSGTLCCEPSVHRPEAGSSTD